MTDLSKPIRLSVRLLPPTEPPEILFSFSTVEEAQKLAADMMKHGFVVQDRTTDRTRHLQTFVPLARVAAINIYDERLG